MKEATTSRTALIVIDVQNGLVDPAGKALHDGFARLARRRLHRDKPAAAVRVTLSH